ncbi:putative gamma-glutamyltransferase YwrD [Folsomia candida]|uniref:Putative gamma-glutamyltransferase YwrD n=1 Tax=Folsomia candida TaxID=158441 RepID=A0A226EPV2_FOLCA|nr:putative gamma-glutamyltransferase YwrD [Folsomia candida]
MDGIWNSRRSPVYAKNGMVACSQPLAAEAGLGILKRSGNAADAAIAVAAALNVTQPTSTGLGGDAFLLYYDAQTKQVKGLNGSGRCPSGVSISTFEDRGFSEQNRPPSVNPLFITVPGAAATWVDTIELFGSGNLTMAQILEPAIALAEDGYPVGQVTAYYWQRSEQLLRNASPNGGEMLLNGIAPKEGEIMRMPYLAETFRTLAANGKAGYYEGRIAQAIVDVVNELGGVMTLADLSSHFNTQDVPISVSYRGVDVYEMPPSGQGITALLALNILEGFFLNGLTHNSAQHLHLVIESLRIAFADTRFYVADPEFVSVPVDGMLSKTYADQRRGLISPESAAVNIDHGFPPNVSNTVYFCVVDGQGNAASFINSNYQGFGTGIVPQGCGFTLHNRGDNFSLDRTHANSLQPGKRPYMQPQGHLQVISNMIDFGMNPQQALDAPRVCIDGGTAAGQILLEDGITEEVRQELERMGHASPTIITGWSRSDFGTGQIIKRDPLSGVLVAGSDARNDGHAVGY